MRSAFFGLFLCGCSAVIGFEPVKYSDSDAGTDAGTGCTGIACQDFSGSVEAPWSLDTNAGASQVVVENGALSVTVPQGVGSGLIAFGGTTFAAGSRAVIRMHITLRETLANASLIELRHPDRNVSGGVSLKLIDGKLAYNVTSRALATTASGVGTTGPTAGTKTCIVFAVDVGASGKVHIAQDSTTVLDAAADTLAGETSWDAIWIGLPFVDAPPGGAEVHLEDITIAHDDLGCTP
jgi:hypothetical protein